MSLVMRKPLLLFFCFFLHMRKQRCRSAAHTLQLIIIIICIFKEDNVFSMTANLPYGPLVNTDIDYCRTVFRTSFCKCCDVSCAIFVRRREASACLIMLSTKQVSHWYHFQRLWYGAAGIRTHDLPLPKRMLYH